MKPRPLLLISDEDTVLQERKGNWAKLPQRQEGRKQFQHPTPELTSSWLCGLSVIQNHSRPQLIFLKNGDKNNNGPYFTGLV